MASGSAIHIRGESGLAERWNRKKNIVITLALIAGVVVAIVVALTVAWFWKPKAASGDPRNSTISDLANVCTTAECRAAGDYIKDNMDLTKDPCNDFLNYVCGGWLQRTKDIVRKHYYTVYETVRDLLAKNMHAFLMIKQISKSKAVNTARDFYQACIQMDLSKERKGLQRIITEIGGFPMYLRAPYKKQIPWFKKLVIVNRDLSEVNRLEYTNFKWAMLFMVDLNMVSEPHIKVPIPLAEFMTIQNDGVLSLICKNIKCSEVESKIIRNQVQELAVFLSKTRELIHKAEKREKNNVTRIALKEFDVRYPGLHMLNFLKAFFKNTKLEITGSTVVTIYDYLYFEELEKLIKSTKREVIDNAIGFPIIYTFPFYPDERATGQNQDDGRKGWCYNQLDYALPFVLGRIFVDEKEDLAVGLKNILVKKAEELRDVFIDVIQEKPWLEQAVKEEAIRKIRYVDVNIGSPRWIKKNVLLDSLYQSKTFVMNQTIIENKKRFHAAHANYFLNYRLKGEVVPDDLNWLLCMPHVVGARNIRERNMIFIPITHYIYKEFYRPNTVKALEYSGVAVTIGHEMGHDLDNAFIKFDATGKARTWFVGSSLQEFENRTKCFIDQYSSIFDPVGQMNLNGVYTLGENIADAVSVRLAYRAYLKSGRKDVRLPGLENISDEQLLFIGSAMNYCGRYTTFGMKTYITTNEHTPDNYRVFLPLSNLDDFSKVFKCPKGSNMNRKDKCVLW